MDQIQKALGELSDSVKRDYSTVRNVVIHAETDHILGKSWTVAEFIQRTESALDRDITYTPEVNQFIRDALRPCATSENTLRTVIKERIRPFHEEDDSTYTVSHRLAS